ncbi:hypothetical protein Dimus_033079 [Dionaea muscipula]
MSSVMVDCLVDQAGEGEVMISANLPDVVEVISSAKEPDVVKRTYLNMMMLSPTIVVLGATGSSRQVAVMDEMKMELAGVRRACPMLLALTGKVEELFDGGGSIWPTPEMKGLPDGSGEGREASLMSHV